MISVRLNRLDKKTICTIYTCYLKDFFARILEDRVELPEYSFCVYPKVIKEFKGGFYLVDIQTALWLCRDDEAYVMNLDFLINVFIRPEKEIILYWENLPKQKIWWQKSNLLFSCDVKKIYDFTIVSRNFKKVKDPIREIGENARYKLKKIFNTLNKIIEEDKKNGIKLGWIEKDYTYQRKKTKKYKKNKKRRTL